MKKTMFVFGVVVALAMLAILGYNTKAVKGLTGRLDKVEQGRTTETAAASTASASTAADLQAQIDALKVRDVIGALDGVTSAVEIWTPIHRKMMEAEKKTRETLKGALKLSPRLQDSEPTAAREIALRNEVATSLTSLTGRMDSQFAASEQRLADAFGTKLAEVVGNADIRFNSLETEMRNRITGQGRLEGDLKALSDRTDTRFSSLEGKMDSGFKGLENLLKALDEKIEKSQSGATGGSHCPANATGSGTATASQ